MLAFLMGAAEKFTQIEVTLPVLAQQDQPGNVLGVFRITQQNIGANDGLDAGCLGSPVELYQGKQVVLVRYGDCGNAQLPSFFHQPLDSNCAINQGIFGVKM